jgi:hypothetical protein
MPYRPETNRRTLETKKLVEETTNETEREITLKNWKVMKTTLAYALVLVFSGITSAQPVCFTICPTNAVAGDEITMTGYDENSDFFDLSTLDVFESNFHGIGDPFFPLLKVGDDLTNIDIVDGIVVFELIEDMLSEDVELWDFFCVPGGDDAAFRIAGGDGPFETVAEAIAAGGTCAGISRGIPNPIIIDPNEMKVPEEGETLYNGIELPDEWPPDYGAISREPMPVPYLKNPPEVIPIDVGRQLFVDDFLIEETTLKRTFYPAEYCSENPVIKAGMPDEKKRAGMYAAPFSGGFCFDPADKLFKIWYTRVRPHATCYAYSKDGIHWEKPELDIEPGTSIVVNPKHGFDSTAVMLDHTAKDPNERFKYFASENFHIVNDDIMWDYSYRTSADGINWTAPNAVKPGIWGDRSTTFYNPFRKMWVLSQRSEDEAERRARAYVEGPTVLEMLAKVTYNGPVVVDDKVVSRGVATGESVTWTGANDIDPRHTDPRFDDIRPHLYNLDASPYESLMIGQFSVWQGPSNKMCGELGLQKRNDILIGFSRDGFHWDRPSRKRFISCTWDEKSWRFGNVQSCASGCLVVGDKLYFYFSGQAKPPEGGRWDTDASTGLAMIRRDGFASMDAGEKTETLTTRPVTFKGKHLFVNVDCPKGELKVEALDEDGEIIEPFTLDNCEQVSVDGTLVQMNWEESKDLAALAGKPVRFRFHLSNGSLYSFWVSPDKSGASYGYVGAGGPGFTGPTDTVGESSL